MPRYEWGELPAEVCAAIEAHTGSITTVVPASQGVTTAVAATLHLGDGRRVFVKGNPTGQSRAVWMLAQEERAASVVANIAPRLLWRIEAAGWLLLGFEHVEGRHADLSPGSSDLSRVAELLDEMARIPAPSLPVLSLAERWGRKPVWHEYTCDSPADLDAWSAAHLAELAAWEARAPELVDGVTLAHTDLTAENFLLGERVRVLDWGASARAAAWVDTAFMVMRLVSAGHGIEQAERWAATIPAWRQTSAEAVTAFAVTVAGIREHLLRAEPAGHRQRLARVAREWAKYRLER